MQTVIGRLETSGKQPKQRGDKYEARCPAHEDNNPSLSISPGTEPDQVLMHCHAGCNIEDITAAIGLEPKDLYTPKQRRSELTELEHYTYTDQHGNPVMRVHRFEPKTFRQSHFNGTSWQWGAGNTPPTLYRLPQILEAIETGQTIYIVEGERDVHTLEQLGHAATTNAGGAGKWREPHTQQLHGAQTVIIIADNDTPGHKHAESIAAQLNWAGITPNVMLPAPGYKDISEHIAAGHALSELQDYTTTDTETPAEAPEIDADDIGHGWEPTDLTEILSGTYEPPVPTIGLRTDGAGLFYPGRINALFGESGSGKSWVAMATCAQEIMAGNHVLYIDHEDHAASVTQRILKLGCAPHLVLEQLHYIRPQRGWNQLAKIDVSALITETAATLVVCDSTGEGMSLDTIDPNSDDQVARWMRDFGRHLADLGPALLLLDHMPKSSEANKAFMIGSQRKKAAIDGAAYRVDVNVAPSKGTEGSLKLVTAKDRGGYYQHGARVADITIVDTDTGIDVIIRPPGTGLPTFIMGQICQFLNDMPNASQNAVLENVTGKGNTVRNALQTMVDMGYVQRVVVDGKGGGYRHTNLRQFDEIELLQTPTVSTVSNRVPAPVDTVDDLTAPTVSHSLQGTRLEAVKPAEKTHQKTGTQTQPAGHGKNRPDIV